MAVLAAGPPVAVAAGSRGWRPMYTIHRIAQIWSDEHTLELWAQVERAILRQQSNSGAIPTHWFREAFDKPTPTVDEWEQWTNTTQHELVGFLKAWGLEHVHIGVTSSDITDTAMAMRLVQTNACLTECAYDLRRELADKAWQTRSMSKVARTHGQAAVPDLIGHKFADLAYQVDRMAERLIAIRPNLAMGKISGPAGGYLHISRDTEYLILRDLGLEPAPCATQILARDTLAVWVSLVAATVSVVEALATEIRLMSHSSIAEATESHGPSYAGSSAMPHKSNPILAERLCGLGRLARAMVEPVMAGIPQWHERDLAHSSVERTLLPILSGLAGYALVHGAGLVRDLRVDWARAAQNLAQAGPQVGSHTAMTMQQYEGLSYNDARVASMETLDRYLVPTPNLDHLWVEMRKWAE